MSGRGSNCDEERAVEVEDKAENNNNNNNNSDNSDNNETAEDAVLDQHQHDHSSLLTVGEKCVHLICEFTREFDLRREILGETVTDVAISLSRLSRTCRTLYVYVRNLPSVLELPELPFSWISLPWGRIGLDVGYWSDIAGLVWVVRDPQQLLSLTTPATAPTNDAICSIDGSIRKSRCDVLLGRLFLNLTNATGISTLSDAERAEFVRILELSGGLSLSLQVKADLITYLGFDLRRCKSLKYLHVSAVFRKKHGYERYERLLGQFAGMEEKPRYAAMTLARAELLTDLSALSSFQSVRAFSAANLTSLEGIQHARFVHLRDLRLSDVSALANVHTVELSDCNVLTDVSSLCNVHTLRLSFCNNITDVSALSAVHKLEIQFCDGVTNLGTLPNLSRDEEAAVDLSGDLSPLRSVDLSYRDDVTDVSMLGHVHTLNLAGCKNITDVSMLGNVHMLDLFECEALTDVSTLGGVHTLDLGGCKALADVSMLGNVHSLYLSGCNGISDVCMLGGVHKLFLDECSGVTDVSALGNVYSLNLNHCNNVSDVSMLGSVHTLSLAWCDWLTDVSPLATVHRLNLSHCNGITDVSALHSVTYLRLFKCGRVTNASTLINKVPYLVF